MTRPPLYVRRPFLAGLVRQLPLLAVLLAVASGLLLVTVDHWRVGLVVVGRGITVGRPLGLLLTRRTENATVTLCHTGTRDLAAHVRNADIVVAAAGVPGLISADIVKPGAAVLDVGVSRVDGKIAGDVALDVLDVAGFVAPNPGGVGPMTRAMLLQNVVLAAEQAAALEALSV